MLTPQDIQQKQFKKEVRGYSAVDVDAFLDQVIESYEHIYSENVAAQDKIVMLAQAVKQYKLMEEELKNALLMAQATGDEIMRSANAEAEKIVESASKKAKKIIDTAKHEVMAYANDKADIKRSLELYKAKMVNLIKGQLDYISHMGVDSDD